VTNIHQGDFRHPKIKREASIARYCDFSCGTIRYA
jgi:hypothetical protein